MWRKAALLILLLFLIRPAYAFDSSAANNKYGIHLAQPEDLDIKGASELVNSKGGKWGYITLVIQEGDRSRDKWQGVLDKLREAHLIPIVRLATTPQGENWRKPTKEDAKDWVNFLDSLNWVVKDRYVVLFNEPNHGREWGGQVNPEDYTRVSLEFAKALKDKNKDFFVMFAGLDASAPSQGPAYEDEGVFLARVVNTLREEETKPAVTNNHEPTNHELFAFIDGLSSHSYPNPGFSGSPQDQGRGTIRNYEWELEYLKNLGVAKELPVFITETGWVHLQSDASSHTIGEYLQYAYQNVWIPDGRVRAVTPFILNYQGEPFLQFSWKKLDATHASDSVLGATEKDTVYYPQYYMIQDVEKTGGDPEQIQKGYIELDLPDTLVGSSTYHFKVKLKDEGQAIWDGDDAYSLKLSNGLKEYFFSELSSIKPHQEADIDLYLKTKNQVGKHHAVIALMRGEKQILSPVEWNFEMIPAPTISFKVNLFPRLRNDANRTYEIQIFDDNEQLVYKKSGLKTSGGEGVVENVPNVYLGKRFRVVILTPHYLPRQAYVTFKRGTNRIKFKRMYPLDFDKDGNFDWHDLWTLFTSPLLLRLWLP